MPSSRSIIDIRSSHAATGGSATPRRARLRCAHRRAMTRAPSITETLNAALLVLAAAAPLSACVSAGGAGDDSAEAGLSGAIAYPFVDETATLGTTPPDDRFVIRSVVGDREYAIEIPGAARDYDVQVPL